MNDKAGKEMSDLYQKIEQAIQRIAAQPDAQPDLEALAAEAGLSPCHFQRVFTRLAGISPKRFLQFTTLETAKKQLSAKASLLDTSFYVGLSGPSRLHDLFLAGEAMSPGVYKAGGEGLELRHGIHETPFGLALLVISPHGICALDFRTSRAETEDALAQLKIKWSRASWAEDTASTLPFIDAMFAQGQPCVQGMKLHLRGTNFQLKVWQALLNIPEGALTDYSAIAQAIGAPKATRAVGSAVGDNPIAFLIPCHRVLRKDGGIGGYATGIARKQAMLAYEALATLNRS